MAKESVKDLYPNLIVQKLTMSAANTLSFGEINVGLNLFDKAALLVSRIEWTPDGPTLLDLDGDGDTIAMGLSSSNNLVSDYADQAEVIDRIALHRFDATAVGFSFLQIPIVHDFSTLTGGGLLIPPKPLYLMATSSGLTIAGIVRLRMYFTIIRLADTEYLELLETRRAFG